GTLEVGLSSSWNLWEGGRVSAEVRESRARFAVADARLEEASGEVAVAVARQYLEVQRAGEALAVSGLRSREAEESLRVARERFEEGLALSAEVLEAERAYRTALAGEAQ